MIEQHKTLSDKIKACKQMVDVFDYHNANVLVDTQENTFMDTFTAWPFRYFVVDNMIVRLIGMPNEVDAHGDRFSMKSLEDFLAVFNYDYEMDTNPVGDVVALMLHSSSGRKGFADTQI